MCHMEACPLTGTWQPILRLRPKKDAEPLGIRFRSIRVCDHHRSISTVETFLSDEGFDKLSRHLRDSGRPMPKRRLVTLDWERTGIEDVPPVPMTTMEPPAPGIPPGTSDLSLTDEDLPF